jgi:excisionase family DNA binding protein
MRNDESRDEALLTLPEVADRLKISRRHLAKVMSEGDGPPVVRIGRRALVRPAALAAWIATREGASDARAA